MSILGGVIIDVIAFSAFGIIHSWLASFQFKERVADKIGDHMAFYRLIYNVVALFMAWCLFEYLPRPDVELFDLPAPYDFITLFFQILSLAGLIWTFKYFSASEFFGISQIIRFRKGQYDPNNLDEELTLRIIGPYTIMRHPLYFFSILFLLFRPTMDLFYLIFLIFAVIYFYVGSFYEEKKLIRVFGSEYIRYKKAVPAIFPYKLFSPYR